MKRRTRNPENQGRLPGQEAWKLSMNPEQIAAIMHDNGPARVLAAAGSGKTRVVTHRIVRMIDGGQDPERILALTFSKKAAEEMNERVKKMGETRCRIGTWHSLCLQILREGHSRWANWEIAESAKFDLKTVLGWKEMDWKGADLNKVSSFVSRCKANLFDPGSEEAAALAKKDFGWDSSRALEAFQRYNDRLEEKQVLTFDDFLVYAARFLGDDENARLEWSSKWDQVIQDEAQDENPAQRRIAHLLAKDHRNYMVVGDVFQAIYAFRGSSPNYLASFDQEWTDAVTYYLPRNYRSGKNIVEAANQIIKPARVLNFEPKDMIAERPFDGKAVSRVAEDLDGEAHNFVSWANELVRTGSSFSDVTALFRTNAQSRALEEALLGARIPYVVVGGVSFYERKEVRDILGYLRIASGRGTTDDVKRCINAPFRFLGARFVERVMCSVEDLIDEGELPNWGDIVREVSRGERIQARQQVTAEGWATLVETIGQRITKGITGSCARDHEEATPSVILEDIVRQTKYLEWITKEEGEESIETSGVANVRELIRVSTRFPTCGELLDYIDETIRSSRRQREDKQAGGERVLLMSVHKSKGLEWPHVWVAGFNEMILPHVKGDIEEERRLAYVAATRARDTLVLSYVRTMATRAGIKDVDPSRFLEDSGIPLDEPTPIAGDVIIQPASYDGLDVN